MFEKSRKYTLKQALNISTRLGGFYFFYYAIVGTFLPFWSLYLEDQGFNYKEIGVLSSIAILTRFFAPFIWGWIADKSGKRMLSSTHRNMDGSQHLVTDFYYSK